MTLAEPIRGKRILVVDDEQMIASVLAEMLAEDGHAVDTAPNGLVALDKVAVSSYDLILSDIRMPALDGPGLYRELERRHPAMLRRILFVTGYAQSQANLSFIEQNGIPCLLKPFTFDDLHHLTQQMLRGC